MQTSSEVICYSCNQRGHMQAQCTANRGNRRGNQRRGNPRGRGGNQRRPQLPTYANVAEALITVLEPAKAYQASVDEEFVLDSGATHSMVHNQKWMTEYHPYATPRQVKLGGSQILDALGSGKVIITVDENGKQVPMQLDDVLYVPKLERNLISLAKLTDVGYTVHVSKEAIKLQLGESEVCADRRNALFVLCVGEQIEGNVAGLKKKVSLREVHRIFAHVGVDALKNMLKREGHEIIDDFVQCEVCIQGKMHRSSFKPKRGSAVADRPGYIHADTCAMRTRSLGGSNYFLTLTDDMSKFRKVYFVQTKDQIPDCI